MGSDIITPRFEADARSLAKRYLVGGLDLPLIIIPGQPFPVTVTMPGVVSVCRKISTLWTSPLPEVGALMPSEPSSSRAVPDSSHPFVAPASTDQRGGSPGLNLMAK